jgi:hypothetical protein
MQRVEITKSVGFGVGEPVIQKLQGRSSFSQYFVLSSIRRATSDFVRWNILYTFRSVKTIKAIPVDNVLVRDALIRLTLDHTIVAIDYFEEIVSSDARIHADSIFAKNARGRHLLEVLPAKRPTREVIELAQSMGIPRWTVTDSELAEEPRRGNEREVWRHARRPVPVHMRMQILAELRRRGAVGMDELLASLVGFPSPKESVLALACAGIVRIDLSRGPISPNTFVFNNG